MTPTRNPIRHCPVSVVVAPPTVEAFDSLEATWLPFVAAAPAGSRLLVVDDAVGLARPPSKALRIVHHVRPLGLGASVQTALWSIATPLALFVPADGSLVPASVERFLERIDETDVVFGCRAVAPTPWPVRIVDGIGGILSRIFLGYAPPERLAWAGWSGWPRRWVARHLFGVPLLDPESGVLLARREMFERIAVQSLGPFVWIEIAAKANHLGRVLDEVAVPGPTRRAEQFAADAARVFRRPDFGPASLEPAPR